MRSGLCGQILTDDEVNVKVERHTLIKKILHGEGLFPMIPIRNVASDLFTKFANKFRLSKVYFDTLVRYEVGKTMGAMITGLTFILNDDPSLLQYDGCVTAREVFVKGGSNAITSAMIDYQPQPDDPTNFSAMFKVTVIGVELQLNNPNTSSSGGSGFIANGLRLGEWSQPFVGLFAGLYVETDENGVVTNYKLILDLDSGYQQKTFDLNVGESKVYYVKFIITNDGTTTKRRLELYDENMTFIDYVETQYQSQLNYQNNFYIEGMISNAPMNADINAEVDLKVCLVAVE